VDCFLFETPHIVRHVIARGKTRKYLKTTTDLVVKQLKAWPLESIMLWHFDPALLFKSL